ncbi:hypothetical protein [Hugenholtzia roseola]|uniref:hypothetical protein n=1 Tax=Hugenholtzia roseola TaxID=1002 RepID=UPI00040600F3|nr:hypothetical protein [Hugenholtzia roseola]
MRCVQITCLFHLETDAFPKVRRLSILPFSDLPCTREEELVRLLLTFCQEIAAIQPNKRQGLNFVKAKRATSTTSYYPVCEGYV